MGIPITLGSAWWPQEPGMCLHPITGFTAQGVGVKLSTQHWSSCGAGHGVKAGLPNTTIPSATSCTPKHFVFHSVLLSCPGCSSCVSKVLCFTLGCSKYSDKGDKVITPDGLI